MTKTIWRFRRDAGGALAVLFALLIIPLMLVVGVGIDMGRYYSYREKVIAGADEALQQALGGNDERSTRERIANARSAFLGLEVSQHINPAPTVNVDIHSSNGSVDGTMTVKANFDLAFGKIIGMRTIPMTVTVKSDKDLNAIQSKRMRCHMGAVEDVKALDCGNFW